MPIWKKPKLNSEKIWKIQRKLWNDMDNMEENVSRIMIRYGPYGRKANWKLKWYGK
jgi:hypothetical protein